MNKYKLAIVFGRFQPLHNEHVRLIDHAASIADRVLILIGSAGEARSTKNPFTYDERYESLAEHYQTHPKGSNIYAMPAYDYLYNNDHWSSEIRKAVKEFDRTLDNKDICVVGHNKDESSFYLSLFPEWDLVEHKSSTKSAAYLSLSSTNVRDILFGGNLPDFKKNQYRLVPTATKAMIYDCLVQDWYKTLRNEYHAGIAYRKSWEVAPFPPIFVAVDSLVFCGDQIVLIKRKSEFGNGKIAMPGGYLNPDETLLQGALRELKEETNISDTDVELIGKPVIFDSPGRSTRGRMITHVFPFQTKTKYITDIDYKAGDDADAVVVMPTKQLEVNRTSFFSDHFHIIFNMLQAESK